MKVVADARRLPEEALRGLRRQAVAAVTSGISQVQVARTFGVSRKTVGAWVRNYRAHGEQAFRPRKRGRRRGEKLALSDEQQAVVVRTVLTSAPEAAGLRYRLWTRQAIAELINREFQIPLSFTTIGNYLVRWGLVEPNLLRSLRGPASGQVPPASATAAMGRPHRAEALWVAWIRPLTSTSSPAVEVPAELRGVNLLLAVSNRGSLSFMTSLRPFDGVHVRDFAERLRRQLGHRATLIVCAWPVGHIDTLSSWASDDPDVVLRA